MKIILLIILIFSLSGCATLSSKEDIVISTPKTVQIDPKLLELCPPLPENVVINTMEEALLLYASNAELYGRCAIKQRDGVTLIKKFGNIK